MENSKLALSDLSEQDPGYGKIFAVLVRRKFWLLGGLGVGLTIAILVNSDLAPFWKGVAKRAKT